MKPEQTNNRLPDQNPRKKVIVGNFRKEVASESKKTSKSGSSGFQKKSTSSPRGNSDPATLKPQKKRPLLPSKHEVRLRHELKHGLINVSLILMLVLLSGISYRITAAWFVGKPIRAAEVMHLGIDAQPRAVQSHQSLPRVIKHYDKLHQKSQATQVPF